ncbi:Uma2 family endonuclease [Gordonia sp. CPCC 205515]|uniref:Uma2 family endonuclease n=1 Tax=Gordonia sp. CPCC 205515 TaxID=3140791 RepID=UPI003AF39873
MTAAPAPQLLSLAEWRALPEDDTVRIELQEGVRIALPRATKIHAQIVARLMLQLGVQLPSHIEALTDVDLVVNPATPATVRVPDIVICRKTNDTWLATDDVMVVVEVLSPGTRRTDLVTKRSEYAEAGVKHYWIIDPTDRILTALELTPHGYDGRDVSGVWTTTVPFTATIDLDAL